MDNVGIESVIQKETSSEICPLGTSVSYCPEYLWFCTQVHRENYQNVKTVQSDFNFFLLSNFFTASNFILLPEIVFSSAFVFSVYQVTS